jgi:hypothetical protein
MNKKALYCLLSTWWINAVRPVLWKKVFDNLFATVVLSRADVLKLKSL